MHSDNGEYGEVYELQTIFGWLEAHVLNIISIEIKQYNHNIVESCQQPFADILQKEKTFSLTED